MEAEKNLSASVESQAASKNSCVQVAPEHEARVKGFAEEMKALADATQVLQSKTGGADEQFRFRDVDTPSRIRSGDSGKACRQGGTLSLAPSSRFTLFRNLEVWCWDLRGSIREGGLITELITPVRVRFNLGGSVFVFQPLHPETGAPLHVCDCSGGLDVHFEFCQRDVTVECHYL